MMLAIAAAVVSYWCSIGYADRLYTWEDDRGVTHITKEPPPHHGLYGATCPNESNHRQTGIK